MLAPGAAELLQQNGIEPIRAAHKLWSVLPNVISVYINMSASENSIAASVADLVSAMVESKPQAIGTTFEEWLEIRERLDLQAVDSVLERGTIRGTQKGMLMQQAKLSDDRARDISELRSELDATKADLLQARARNDARLEAGRDAIRGTEKGRLLQRAEQADEFEKAIATLGAEVVAKDAEIAHLRETHAAEMKEVRSESKQLNAELRASLTKKEARIERLQDKLLG